MPAGRPPIFETPEQMQDVIDSYFHECQENQRPLLITGLAYHLGMTRQSLCNYEKRDQFFDTIKRAKLRVEMSLEEALHNPACTGTIFNLKNNFEWKDTREFTGEGGGPIEFRFTPVRAHADGND